MKKVLLERHITRNFLDSMYNPDMHSEMEHRNEMDYDMESDIHYGMEHHSDMDSMIDDEIENYKNMEPDMHHDMEPDMHHDMEPDVYYDYEDYEDYEDSLHVAGNANTPLEFENGVITKDSLYNHFDLNNDGKVTKDEYVKHIQYHCESPASLDHYRNKEYSPCEETYNRCKDHFSKDHKQLSGYLQNAMEETGSSCHVSVLNAMIDAISYMKKIGII